MRIGSGSIFLKIRCGIPIGIRRQTRGGEIREVQHLPCIGDAIAIGIRPRDEQGREIGERGIERDPAGIRGIGLAGEKGLRQPDPVACAGAEVDPPRVRGMSETCGGRNGGLPGGRGDAREEDGGPIHRINYIT